MTTQTAPARTVYPFIYTAPSGVTVESIYPEQAAWSAADHLRFCWKRSAKAIVAAYRPNRTA